MEKIMKLSAEFPEIGVLYCNLENKIQYQYNLKKKYLSASMIKIFIMATLYSEYEKKRINVKDRYRLSQADFMPSCGVLSYLDKLNTYSLEDICRLMIIVSDNSAANFLIDVLGIANINHTINELGMLDSILRRKFFDERATASGLENEISPFDLLKFFDKLFKSSIFSYESSQEMMSMLLNQQQNEIIPFYLPDDILVAHKIGLDDLIYIDSGIIFSKKPYFLCLCCDNRNYREVREPMAKLAKLFYVLNEKEDSE